MSAKPESTFIRSVHKHLPDALYCIKNNNPYAGGQPDCWYSGYTADLWVEYKFIPAIPKTVNVKINLSELQLEWLRKRHKEGRNVAVIVGCPKGGVLLRNLKWESTISPVAFTELLQNRAALAACIAKFVG